jgi:lipoprotein-anchoring transpeptidase ErfK/SrfK
VVGLHGDWHQPWLIPGRPSHGCVRLHGEDVRWLAHHIATGTPLRIL